MSEIDRQLDAAWRAASREQPPATLDAAIRAAARRAVDAGPGKPEARSWWRVKTHWMPLAAAAAVAVIAVGLIQLTPPERVTPGFIADRSASMRTELASRQPSPPSTVAESARRDPAVAADELARERDADRARKRFEQAPTATQSPSNAVLEKKQNTESGAAAPAERQLAAALERSRPTKTETPGENTATAARSEPVQAAAPERAQAAKPKKDEGGSPWKLARSDPFPAATPPGEAGAAQAARTPPPAGKEAFAAAGPGPIGAASPSAPPAQRGEPFPAAPHQDKVAANVPRSSASLPGAAPPQAAGLPASQTDQVGQAMGPAAVASADRASAKDAGQPRPADEWIKLIRRLRAEGKTEEATKELAAFRAAYKERADELLPVDLREGKP